MTDLPAPPFVENTVMTRPSSPPASRADRAGAGGRPAEGVDDRGAPPRCSCDGVDRRGRARRWTPAAQRRRNRSVVSSVGDEDGADLGLVGA